MSYYSLDIKLTNFCDAFETPFSNTKAFQDYIRHQTKQRFHYSCKSNGSFLNASASNRDQSEISFVKGSNPLPSTDFLGPNSLPMSNEVKTEDSERICRVGTPKNPMLSFGKERISRRNRRCITRPIVCGTCFKRFKWQSHLIIHQRCHTKERPYGCYKCKKSYTQYGALNRHLRVKHSIKTSQLRTLSDQNSECSFP